jgi:hypothetical protein
MRKEKFDCSLFKGKNQRARCFELFNEANEEDDLKRANDILDYFVSRKQLLLARCDSDFRKGSKNHLITLEIDFFRPYFMSHSKLRSMLPVGKSSHPNIGFNEDRLDKLFNLRYEGEANVISATFNCSELKRF